MTTTDTMNTPNEHQTSPPMRPPILVTRSSLDESSVSDCAELVKQLSDLELLRDSDPTQALSQDQDILLSRSELCTSLYENAQQALQRTDSGFSCGPESVLSHSELSQTELRLRSSQFSCSDTQSRCSEVSLQKSERSLHHSMSRPLLLTVSTTQCPDLLNAQSELRTDSQLSLPKSECSTSIEEDSSCSSSVGSSTIPKTQSSQELSQSASQGCSDSLSSGSTKLSKSTRLFKKQHQSASDVTHHRVRTNCDNSLNQSANQSLSGSFSANQSPSNKSVRSLSALTPNRSLLNRSWLNSISKGGIKRIKKKSLTSLFDAVSGQGNSMVASGKNKLNKSDWDLNRIPRANSAGQATAFRTSISSASARRAEMSAGGEMSAGAELSTLQLTRLGSSDLRNLEKRLSGRILREDVLCGSQGEREDGNDSVFLEDLVGSPFNGRRAGTRGSPHPQGYYTIDTRGLASKHKHKSFRDKKLLYGVKQFNLEPAKGLSVLMDSGFLERDDPKSVALFLYREGRLSKKQIGKFLGGADKFQQQVLMEFVKCHAFTHLILVQALRQFLWSFRLPGEAQQIDRVMEAFAEHYCQQNPNLFEERDTCYILSFSIIMLNTALHNVNVKQKISVEQFIKQNRGINSGKDLPRDILELIYRSIREEPFKIPDETYDDLMYTFFSPEKEGWLWKQGGSWKSWKRRWFVLSDRCLYYFQHTAENVPKGIIPLENVKVQPIENVDNRSYCFEVYSEFDDVVKGCKQDAHGTVVQGNHKSYRMSAGSDEERQWWIQCIRDSIQVSSFSVAIAKRKEVLRQKKTSTSGSGSTSGPTSGSQNSTPRKGYAENMI